MLQAGRVSGTAEHRHPAWQPGRPARQVVSSDCRQIRKPSGAALVAVPPLAAAPLLSPAFAPAALTWPKAECASAYGKIACGYGCVVGYGEVGCATTPWGACVAAYGSITCASGDASLVQAARWGTEIPRATCVTAFGQRACGWGCAASRGVTVCATTPWSACDVALDGRPVCSDPPPLAAPPAP